MKNALARNGEKKNGSGKKNGAEKKGEKKKGSGKKKALAKNGEKNNGRGNKNRLVKNGLKKENCCGEKRTRDLGSKSCPLAPKRVVGPAEAEIPA